MKDSKVMWWFAAFFLGLYLFSIFSLTNTDYLVISSVYVVGSILARKIDEINMEKQDV